MTLLSERKNMNHPGTLLFHKKASFFCVIVDKGAWIEKVLENNLDFCKSFFIGNNYVPVYVFGDVLPVVLSDFFSDKTSYPGLESPKLWPGSSDNYEVIFDLASALSNYVESIVISTDKMGEAAKAAAFSAVRELSIFSHYSTSLISMPLNNSEIQSLEAYTKVYHSLKIPTK